jgi:hypothetical protein
LGSDVRNQSARAQNWAGVLVLGLLLVVTALVALLWSQGRRRAHVDGRTDRTTYETRREVTSATEVKTVVPDAIVENPEMTVLVRGRVACFDGSALPARSFVRAVAQASREVVRDVEVGPDGAFTMQLDVAAPRSDYFLVASADTWTSHPKELFLTRGGGPERDVILKLVPGCRVTGKAVDGEGRPVPGATFLLTQLAQSSRYVTIPREFHIDARRTIDEYIDADGGGLVTAVVREGRFEFRASRDGVVFGPRVRLRAPRSGAVDAGLVPVPERTVRITLAVTDDQDRPLSGIGVRFTDRTLRFGNPDETRVGAHLRTGGDGCIALTIDAAHLPLAGAAGSREFFCREVVWTEEMRAARIQLTRRPHVDLVLRSPSGEVVPIDIDWHAERLDGEPEDIYGMEVTPLNVLRLYYDTGSERSARPGVKRITLAAPGRYRFTAQVPGGPVLEVETAVTEGDVEVAVTVEGLRRVELRLHNAPQRTVRLAVRPRANGAATTVVEAQPGQASVTLWVPESVHALDVRCVDPWTESSFAAGEEKLDLDLRANEINCTLDAGSETRVVLRYADGTVRAFAADSHGRVGLRLPPGSYDVTHGPATEWRRFGIREGERLLVDLRSR